MKFLRVLGGIVVFIWFIRFLFRFGGSLIHLLLIVVATVFIADKLFGENQK